MNRPTPYRRRFLDSVRARLTVVIVLALLPVLAFSLASAVRQYNERKELAERELLRIAELMPHEVGAVFDSAEQIMLVSRTQSVVARGDLPTCRQVLAGALAGRAAFSNIWTVDATGRPLCSAVDLTGPASYSDSPWFQRFQRLRTFSVSGPLAGETAFTAALPLSENTADGPLSVTVISIRTTLLESFSRVASLPPETAVFLMNADGEPLLNGAAPDLLPEKAALDRVLSEGGGFVTAASRAGDPYIYVSVPLHRGEIVGIVAHRVKGADAPLFARLAIEAGLPVLLAAITLLVVWLAIDRVSTRWIRRFHAVVQAQGQGTFDVRVRDLEAAPLEYRELGEALNRMSEAIKQRQQRLASIAESRELLLREVHHRVRNNLQIIISLFSLMARNAENEDTELLIRDMLARIECLALVHHAAYRSGDVQRISMQSFIPELLTSLTRTMEDESVRVQVDCQVDDIALTMDETIPLAQFIAEAVTNTLKHAFVGRSVGHLSVRLEHIAAGEARLVISDDGVGFPADFDTRPARRRLGLSLLEGFAQQLGGGVEFQGYQEGTRIVARLKYAQPQGPGVAELAQSLI